MRDSFLKIQDLRGHQYQTCHQHPPPPSRAEHFFLYPGGRVFKKFKAAHEQAERSAVLPVSDRALRQRRGRIPRHRQASSCHRQRYGQTERHLRRRRWRKRQPCHCALQARGTGFFWICRNEYTHISSEDDPWELMWIHFYGPQCDAYYDYFLKQQTWHFHTAHLAELTAAIQSVIRFHEEPTDDTDLLTAQQIVNILTLICIEANEKGNTDSVLSDKLKSILHYLDEHYVEDISLDLLAERFFISKYYLSHEFKKEYGTTIIQYILTKKITTAKELLRYSNSSIEEIARLCGIDDASYFNKVFKKMEGWYRFRIPEAVVTLRHFLISANISSTLFLPSASNSIVPT